MSFSSQLGLGDLSFSDWVNGPFQFVIPINLGVSSALELDGAAIAIATGTEMETAVANYFRYNNISYEPVPAVSVEEAETLFLSGAADVLVLTETVLASGTTLRIMARQGIEALPEVIAGISDPGDPGTDPDDPGTDPTDPDDPGAPADDDLFVFAITPFASLTGAKLVPSGSVTAANIQALGANSISIAAAEWYAALTTGVVDGIVAKGATERDALRETFSSDVGIFDINGEAIDPIEPVEPTDPDDPGDPDDGGNDQPVDPDTNTIFAIDDPGSLEGDRLVVVGDTTDAEVEALGAVPVRLPAGEIYVALLRGVVDGVLTTNASDFAQIQRLLPSDVNTFEVGDNSPAGPTSGDDDLVGTRGADVIDLLDGDDTYSAKAGSDQVNGGRGNDDISGGGGSDRLNGGAGRDNIKGGDGGDVLIGGGGRDKLDGGKGRDTLKGGGGNDRLDGGKGNDILTGGKGEDVFLFNFENTKNRDTITDFNVDRDTIRAEDSDYRLSIVDGDAILRFGDGQVLVVEGVTQRKALNASVETNAAVETVSGIEAALDALTSELLDLG